MTLTPNDPPRTRFLGVDYDPLEMDAVVSRLLERPAEAPFAALVTPNSAHVVRLAEGDPAIARAYSQAWLCVNDSRVVHFLAKSRRVELPATPGADLVIELLGDPRFDRSSPVLLVGGDTETFDALVTKACLTAARHFEAPMRLLSDRLAFDQTVAFVESNPSRYVFLAVGSPQQELLAEDLRRRGEATGVGLCIGAGVEFLTGRRKRAPAWLSRIGMEWLFRLASEPRRLWRRYLVDSPRILRLYLKEFTR
ncbi:WecB/TagA/CpsF family glycosyltransferase [Methylopila turkensis]|uniref:Glycosyl transferase n=1 Tax=Methylopila turkensis TaxID=1437816 RepID=A0A9W6N8U6_9HYPH|nr:WecB/TagA/CpsF family glycosyltransferase [Methylopila turkensis]GLK81895.1 glycosyl transferase [Methylopila turkensis]